MEETFLEIFSLVEKMGLGNVLTIILFWFFLRPFFQKHLLLIDTLTNFISKELSPLISLHSEEFVKLQKDIENANVAQKKSLFILDQLAKKQNIDIQKDF